MITKYTYTKEDYHKYYTHTWALLGGDIVYISDCEVDTLDDDDEVDDDDDNWQMPIGAVIVQKVTNPLYKERVALKDLVFLRPGGITVELSSGAGAGYVNFSANGYKKGINIEEYRTFSPFMQSMELHVNIYSTCRHTYEKIQTDSQIKNVISQLYNRKRTTNYTAVQETLMGERYGCIIDKNYYLSQTVKGIELFFKTRSVGLVLDGCLQIPKTNQRITKIAKKLGWSINEANT